MKKTKKLISGVIISLVAGSLSGCNKDELPPQPDEESCKEWEWDDDTGVWECDDSRSSYHGYYFLGGMFYQSKSKLTKSTAYKSYKSSSSFKGGFGSGSKGSYGG